MAAYLAARRRELSAAGDEPDAPRLRAAHADPGTGRSGARDRLPELSALRPGPGSALHLPAVFRRDPALGLLDGREHDALDWGSQTRRHRRGREAGRRRGTAMIG